MAYEARDGVIDLCERCHMVAVNWNTCHVDHNDLSRDNNAPGNLVVCCVGCNTQRNAVFRGALLTAHGETKGYRAWSADPRVIVAENTIRTRKARGLSDHDALFADRVTYKSSPPAKVARNKFEGGRRVSV